MESISIGNLSSALTINATQFSAGLQSAGNDVQTFDDEINSLGADIDALEADLDKIGSKSADSFSVGGNTLRGVLQAVDGFTRMAKAAQRMNLEILAGRAGIGEMVEATVLGIPVLGNFVDLWSSMGKAIQDGRAALAKLNGEANERILELLSDDTRLDILTKEASLIDNLIKKRGAAERRAESERLSGMERERFMVNARYQDELSRLDEIRQKVEGMLGGDRATGLKILGQLEGSASGRRDSALDKIANAPGEATQKKLATLFQSLDDKLFQTGKSKSEIFLATVRNLGATQEELDRAERRFAKIDEFNETQERMKKKEKEAAQALNRELKLTERILKGIQTPSEKFAERFQEIASLASKGKLSLSQRDTAVDALKKQFAGGDKFFDRPSFGAVTKGASGTTSVVNRNRDNFRKLKEGTDKLLLSNQRMEKIMERVARGIEQGVHPVVSLN